MGLLFHIIYMFFLLVWNQTPGRYSTNKKSYIKQISWYFNSFCNSSISTLSMFVPALWSSLSLKMVMTSSFWAPLCPLYGCQWKVQSHFHFRNPHHHHTPRPLLGHCRVKPQQVEPGTSPSATFPSAASQGGTVCEHSGPWLGMTSSEKSKDHVRIGAGWKALGTNIILYHYHACICICMYIYICMYVCMYMYM